MLVNIALINHYLNINITTSLPINKQTEHIIINRVLLIIEMVRILNSNYDPKQST